MYSNKALLSTVALAGACLAQSDSSTAGDLECTSTYYSLLANAPTPTGSLGAAFASYASTAASSFEATATDAGPAAILGLATQVCEFSSALPSSLHSDFDAYATSVLSYVSASSSAIDAAITGCLETGAIGTVYVSVINSLATHSGPLCDITSGLGSLTSSGAASATDSNGATITPTPTPTGSGDAGASGAGGSATTPTTAAAQPTAVVKGAAAAAAAGLLGAVVLL
ncbi:hypothetical protein F4777DRAFT_528842 [Nemania sp. FL0916]|nr:hypothetical protein F4777DRAFT_528842 [Nemania sp. FL0916]